MEFIYNLSAFIIALGTPALIAILIVVLVKPHVLNNRIKKTLSRSTILGVGIAVIFTTLIGFGSVMAATEPESVKQERITRQLAEEKAKKDAEVAKAKLLAEQAEQAKLREAEALKPQIKTSTKTEAVIFESIRKDDNSIPQGEERVSIEGVNGEKAITYEVTYVKEKEIARKVIKEEIVKSAINKVILVGTYIKPVTRSYSTAPAIPQPQTSSAYYKNCSAARAAGAAPVYRGQPGYGRHLDRDNDGIGCE